MLSVAWVDSQWESRAFCGLQDPKYSQDEEEREKHKESYAAGDRHDAIWQIPTKDLYDCDNC
jgi:hypothetical protein